MTNFLNKQVRSLKPSGIRKFFELVSSMPDVISLGVGEPDFATPWSIREAAIYSLEKGETGYAPNSGLLPLRIEISHWLNKKYGLKYKPQTEILITVGVAEAFDLAVRSTIEQGTKVLVPDPAFVMYEPLVRVAGGDPVFYDAQKKDPTVELERIGFDAKILILNYPSNPVGITYDSKVLHKIALLANKFNWLVISDEVYSELVYSGKHTSFATLPNMRERTVVLNGLSKSHAMTGFRIGYVLAPAKLIEGISKIHQYGIMSVNTTAQAAAVEAFKSGDIEVEKMKEEYDRRRKFLVSTLNKLKLKCVLPEGAFYVFPSIKNTGLTSEEFAEKLLEDQTVAVVPGTAFGKRGEGYIRMSYASSMDNLVEAMKRIEVFLKKLRKK